MVVVTGRYRRAGQRGRHVGLWETRLVSAVSPPKHAGGQTNQARLAAAVALHQQGRLTEAEALYRDILRRDPNHFDALHLCGVAALQARRTAEGVALVRDAIALHAGVAEAHGNLANGLRELRRFEEALPSFDRAIALKPNDAQLHRDRAMTLQNLGRHAEALAGLADAVALQPDLEFAPGMIVHTRMLMCDWDGLDHDLAALIERVARGDKAAMPFTVIAWSDSPRLQRQAAEIYVRAKCPANATLPPIARHPPHERLRVGYFSADLHNHATAWLAAELFERHDPASFELTAFAWGSDGEDAMRARLVAGFDRFIDVRDRSDRDVAALARELQIDIAVDLKGFTKDFRTGIFACRAAPVQVSYLGYPGTMGADYIDYIVADPPLIQDAEQQHYAEKIVWLPDSYQVNDSRRRIADRTPTRAEADLPPEGFVFCCFNQSLKITPAVFAGWMRILRQVEGSVLWLFQDNDAAVANLRAAAAGHGIDPGRLVFAARQPLPDHLARHRLADLFLDTAPYNAHTTASDALWAGLPVLTRMGATFASRVAASLLHAVGLPELITTTPDAYEALAVALATNPDALAALRQTLARNRPTAALFDTARFTTHLESAYRTMAARYQAGLPPDHIRVPATQIGLSRHGRA
jgi:predicted O-linked N-acetylglucosamine transferase (SPINDLY family)